MDTKVALLFAARRVLHLSQRELGNLLSVNVRTVQRWEARRSDVGHVFMCQVAAAVHPVDPDLAARIATSEGTTLEALGIVQPPPPAPARPPPPPPPPPPAPAPARPAPAVIRALVDAAVYAAADTLSAPPASVRPALASAVRKAAEVGLTLEDLLSTLSPSPLAEGEAAARGARGERQRRARSRRP